MTRPGIRSAVAADRPALLALWVAAWARAMPAIDFSARREWIDARLDELARAGAAILVAGNASGGVEGFVTVDPATGHVDQLAVSPDRQGRGLGRALLAAAKRHARGPLVLEVNQENERAVGFYGSEGFTVVEAGVNALSGRPIWRMRWARGADPTAPETG